MLLEDWEIALKCESNLIQQCNTKSYAYNTNKFIPPATGLSNGRSSRVELSSSCLKIFKHKYCASEEQHLPTIKEHKSAS